MPTARKSALRSDDLYVAMLSQFPVSEESKQSHYNDLLCLSVKHDRPILMPMNKLPTAKRVEILGLMVEGVSIRAITRITGASKNTVVKLLADAG